MKFIDTTPPLLGADGKPRAECFIPGDIHMLPACYAVWKSVIAPVVIPAECYYGGWTRPKTYANASGIEGVLIEPGKTLSPVPLVCN